MSRNPGAFYDARAGCWASSSIGEARTTKDGRSYRTKVRNKDLVHPTKDRLAAQAWVQSVLDARRAGFVIGVEPTFREVTQHYLHAQEPRLAAETYSRLIEHLDRFGAWPAAQSKQRMDLRSAARISRADVHRFASEMLDGGASASYVSDGLLKNLKACYRWAASVDPGRYPGLPLAANPLAGLRGPEKQRRAFRPADPEAVRRFLRWTRARSRGRTMLMLRGRFARIQSILLTTLRDTGARPKDLCVAEWSEWSLRPDGWGLITLPPWKWKNGAKTGQGRTIAVPPGCAKRIEWIRALPGRHPERIFTHRRNRGNADGAGSPWAGDPWVWVDAEKRRTGDTKSLQKWFYRVKAEGGKAGYPLPSEFRLYWFRSGYSNEAQRAGANRMQLAQQMGTSERMLQNHYTDSHEGDAIAAAIETMRGRSGRK